VQPNGKSFPDHLSSILHDDALAGAGSPLPYVCPFHMSELNMCTYAPTQSSLVRMFSRVMSWGAKMCHLLPRVFSPENVSGTLHLLYFWEYIYIYVRSFTSRVLDVPSIALVRRKAPLSWEPKMCHFILKGFLHRNMAGAI
jgi:hypothetical protein